MKRANEVLQKERDRELELRNLRKKADLADALAAIARALGPPGHALPRRFSRCDGCGVIDAIDVGGEPTVAP